jgi:hypothetical protein
METTGDQPPTPPPAMTPPTEVGEIVERPSQWPTALGVVAIIFGILGILMYGCGGIIGNVVAPMFASQLEGMPVQEAQLQVMRRFTVINLLSSLVATSLAVWLLVTGIGILRRRPWSRTSGLGWSVARMIYAVPATLLGYIVNRATVQAMEQAAAESGDPMPKGIFAIMEALGAIGMGCTLVWSWALPVFMIVWFLRAPIKDELSRWALESRAAI